MRFAKGFTVRRVYLSEMKPFIAQCPSHHEGFFRAEVTVGYKAGARERNGQVGQLPNQLWDW